MVNMKIKLTFKTPDVLSFSGIDELPEEEQEKAKNLIEKYVRWGEYIDVEFNIETGEVNVLGVKK